MFVICFIGVAILGGMINRKTNKVKVTKNKMFLPTAIVSVTFVGISLLYMVVAQFVDLGIVAVANKNI
jgi:CHASE2 domain-containing sensor protein